MAIFKIGLANKRGLADRFILESLGSHQFTCPLRNVALSGIPCITLGRFLTSLEKVQGLRGKKFLSRQQRDEILTTDQHL